MSTKLITPASASVEYQEAVQLHREIMANATVAASALLEMSKGLKRMRDGKLYVQLGFDSFDEYVEQMTGFKKRQAYNYISVYEKYGEKFLREHADLGVTKLNLLAQLPLEDREELLEGNDLTGMSASEIQKLIEKNRQFEQQISLIRDDKERLEEESADEAQRLRAQITALSEENKALKTTMPELNTEQVQRIEQEARQKAEAGFREQLQAMQNEIKTLKDAPLAPDPEELERARREAWEAAEAEASKRLETAKAEADKRVEAAQRAAREAAKAELDQKYQDMLDELKTEKAAADQRLAEMERQTAAPGADPDMLRFNFYFEAAQMNLGQMKATLGKLRQAGSPDAEKIEAAMRKFIGMMPGKLGIA